MKIRRFLYAILAIALFAQGCASAEVRALRRAYKDASSGEGPAPLIYQTATGEREWKTHDGIDLGTELGGMWYRRTSLYYFDLNLLWEMRDTNKGNKVGTIVSGLLDPTNRFFVAMSKTGDSYQRVYMYGPNLKSIREWRKGEKEMLDKGGDVFYITNEGTFKASELGD